jgi:hypothetical protein
MARGCVSLDAWRIVDENLAGMGIDGAVVTYTPFMDEA